MALLVAAAASIMGAETNAKIYHQQGTLLRQALPTAAHLGMAQLEADINGGTPIAGPYPTLSGTIPACGNGQKGYFCADTIKWSATVTGDTQNHAPSAAVYGGGVAVTQDNVNVGTDPNGTQVSATAVYRVQATLISQVGKNLTSMAGTAYYLILDASPHVQFDHLALDDAASSGVADASTVGQCDTANCGSTGASGWSDDLNGGTSSVTPTNTLVHANTLCYDPNAAGDASLANRCAPSGNATATPHPVDSYANPTYTNGANAPSGWKP